MAIHPKDPIPEVAAAMARHLDAAGGKDAVGALCLALEYADMVSQRAWEGAQGKPSRERLQITLEAAVEALQALGAAVERTSPAPEE